MRSAPSWKISAGLDPRQPRDGDTAVLVYTSGTTGTPKGAELTHFQLFMNADTPGRVFGIRDDDIVMVALPLFHVFGLSSQLNVCVRFGATMSLVPRFDATKALEVIQRGRVTIFEGVPTMYIAVLRHPNAGAYDVSTLRIGISGGAPLPAEVLDAFEKKFGIVILEGYGLTETASTTTFNVSAGERKIYSIGSRSGASKCRSGTTTIDLYPTGPATSAKSSSAESTPCGDTSESRRKPPRPSVGEEIKAFVQLKTGAAATEGEIIAYVKKRIAAYKYPRIVEFSGDLPIGPTGKVLKKELTTTVA